MLKTPKNQKFSPGTVRPGQFIANKAPAQKVRTELASSSAVDAAFAQLKDYWRDLLSIYTAKVPDPHVVREP